MASAGTPSSSIPNGSGTSVALIRTEWNTEIVDALRDGAKRVLTESGSLVAADLIVPGAIEIPFGIRAYWKAVKDSPRKPDAIIAFGCVIRGDTPHFDYVCQSVTDGITRLNAEIPVPVIFGILTVDNITQARERIGGRHGHKGDEAAEAALKMIYFCRSAF